MTAFVALYKLFFRVTATRGRLAALGLLALGMVLLALTVRNDQQQAWGLFSLYALGGLVPIASLVIASSTFGDLVDDLTLVHIWLRPVSRFAVVIGAWLSSVSLVLPFTVVVPGFAMFVADLSVGAIGRLAFSALLGSLAYCAVFVALGLRLKRALAWGLAYILIWEGAVANAGSGLARLALRLSTRSIAFRAFPDETIRFPLSTATSIVVLASVTVAGLAFGVRWLRRAEVA